ncbi:MAG: leucyl aminopeptidase family protein [Bermanella sp.]
MHQTIKHASDGIPLHLLQKTQFSSWLATQPPSVKNWLNSTQYQGNGLTLIPDSNGELACALFCSHDLQGLFASADIAKQLPPRQFVLNCDAQFELNAAIAWGLSSYQFDKYKKIETPRATLAMEDGAVAQRANHVINATCLVRDMINTPAGDMMPEHMANTVEAVALQFGGTFSQLVDEELLEHNYPTIHAVGRASVHAPRLLDLRWGDQQHPKVTLVGKGVCFDSGGLDLKPSAAMRLMKKDMGGAAHVLGLAYLIMSHKLPIQLRVIIPSVENAVSANAFRPGDVLQTRHGISVEVDNTDAEGRLVLCDALSEACNDKPDVIFDFATLTGACRVALGTELPGFFSTDNQIAQDLMALSENNHDPVWRLPLHKAYRNLLKSDVADISNCAATPFGGAITAALYLQEFVAPDIPWLHFDVMAWNNRPLPGRPLGGEAFGIRSVFDYLAQRYGA